MRSLDYLCPAYEHDTLFSSKIELLSFGQCRVCYATYGEMESELISFRARVSLIGRAIADSCQTLVRFVVLSKSVDCERLKFNKPRTANNRARKRS